MKKMIAMLLTPVMCLSLAACGSSTSSTSGETKADETKAAAAESTSAAGTTPTYDTVTLKLSHHNAVDQPIHEALTEWADMLKEKYSDIKKLNEAWGANYSTWEDLLSRDDFIPSTKASQADLLAFEEAYYDKYFSVCRKVIKQINPNLMFLGCRFAWNNPLVVKSAAKYCDVLSFNLYRNNVAGFSLPEGCRDVPIIVSEFHFGATDKGVFGGGIRFRRSSAARAKAFEEFVTSAIENPNIVGVHWYEWADSPTSGGEGGGNYADGLVDICDTPHESLTKSIRKLSEKMYDIRFKGEKTVESSDDKTFVF